MSWACKPPAPIYNIFWHFFRNFSVLKELSFQPSTFFRLTASYLWVHPSCGNVLYLVFDGVSAAWDNLSFWGYDEPSEDYHRRNVDARRRCGCHGADAAGSAA